MLSCMAASFESPGVAQLGLTRRQGKVKTLKRDITKGVKSKEQRVFNLFTFVSSQI